ncbi:16S rRNA (uracil(1498)-N(3))-methyltransferase [Paenarthrobacter sp. Z7-10]|uniref:16S rRNA (uracil(1498)-N(3))-methyltransferase n=1 Tax=Paenarthrobacter sp. Z7-10 TaxID=2787635 RepID=UPI0022A96D12|nr:16S rRNA (uracil(1498)-N(3))-methyltransferase [Paenarthrobacter sp. Z7-10]MCZ2402688.1 16S rRNA (uracil(1498)-N(3))-methyltransferase [Paenarthrobacter sp. Z7-10]
MTRPIFFAAAAELAALTPGAGFTLTGAEGRHASTVKRLTAGEKLDIVDGCGLRVSGTVTAAAAGELELRVDSICTEPMPAQRLVLVQALAKGDRDLLAIETATELGVDAVLPWQAERSIVRWKGERSAKSLAKWRGAVTAAAKQARRAWIPTVGEAVDSAALARLIASAPLAMVLSEEAESPLRSVIETWRATAPQSGAGADAADGSDRAGGSDSGGRGCDLLMIVGPEGGISDREMKLFSTAGAKPVRLGPHVLRSSTAGPAAVALLSEQLGRW